MHAATQQAIDSVKAQVEELKKNYKELTDLCQSKRDLFIVCVKFHMMTRQVSEYLGQIGCKIVNVILLIKVQQWKDEVLEYLASLYLEDMSEEEASTSLKKIEEFQEEAEATQMDTITELANSLPVEKHFKKVEGNVKEK